MSFTQTENSATAVVATVSLLFEWTPAYPGAPESATSQATAEGQTVLSANCQTPTTTTTADDDNGAAGHHAAHHHADDNGAAGHHAAHHHADDNGAAGHHAGRFGAADGFRSRAAGHPNRRSAAEQHGR